MDAAPIILVHGLWMGAWAMRSLAKRLRQAGRAVHLFNYPTRTNGIADNAQRLAQFAADLGDRRVDFVAHSLGGLVTLHALAGLPEHHGRVVLLGSPINGSTSALRFASWPGANLLLGRAYDGLTSTVPVPGDRWRVSMIAGSVRLGLGVLVSPAEPGDGTVALAETRSDWLYHHQVLPESHSSLLFSNRVAAAVAERLN